MAPAMPCNPSVTKVMAKPKNGNEKKLKTMYCCKVESREARQRAESSQSKIHEDRIAGKGTTSMTHYNLVHQFILMPQAMKIPDAKAAVDKEWKMLDTIPAWNFEKKVKSKKGVYPGGTNRQQESPLCHIDGHMSPQECGVGNKLTEEQRQSRAPGGHCKGRLWSLRSVH